MDPFVADHQLQPMHDIVAQIGPSDEQAPAVRLRRQDVAVTAGAGTGKTRTLVARYLSLLAEGVPLRAVVAVTFTRKAAREMRNRVRDEIRRYLERPKLDAAERLRWQGLYSALDAARIGTIHSLCSEILRSHPAEAGVDPRFETLEEGQANLLLDTAVDEALALAADDADLAGLFPLLGESGLRRTLRSMLGARLEYKAGLASLEMPLWPVWEVRLLAPVRAFIDDPEVLAAFEGLLAIRDSGGLAQAEAAGDILAAPLRRLLERWEEMSRLRAGEDWAGIAGHLVALRSDMSSYGQAGNWRPHNPKGLLAVLRARFDAELKGHLAGGLDLERERRLAESVPWLRALFAHATGAYRRLKEERQALDFDDLEAGALDLLRQRPEVRSRWQTKVQALLVDEFQDTNGRQRDLVSLLNGRRGRLFIVGDAKQSIYRFRGADVVVFRQERARIEREGGAALSLKTSYRAHRELIDGLNALLRPVLGEEADPRRPWAEPFAPLVHDREVPRPGLGGPFIELHLSVGTKREGALGWAAGALVRRIVELVSSTPLGYGDVAILCRATASFAPYENALERAGVPFLTVAGRGFYGRAEIRDLLNAMQALADPTDDLALAGLLRSPACGLPDTALVALCAEREAQGASLWEATQRLAGQPALAEADRANARRAARLIGALHEQVGRAPVADVLKAFLDATDYRAALIEAGQTRGARNVAKLLTDAHASGIVGVGEFIEYINGLRDSGAREGEARAITEGAVQIMTVHAAKGLEFPVVVIGDVTRAGKGTGGLLLDPELGPLVPVKDDQRQDPAIYRLGKVREEDQEAAESDRLLYVAATRAQDMLMLSGCVGLNKDSCFGKLAGWLGRLTGDAGLALAGRQIAYDSGGAGSHCLDLAMGSVPIACTVYEPGYGAAPGMQTAAEWEPAVDPSLPPPLLPPVRAGEETADEGVREREHVPVQRVWRVVPAAKRPKAPAWVVGSLVHEALAWWRFPDGTGQEGRERSFEQWARARARSYGLADPQQLDNAAREAERLLRRFQRHELFQEMDAAERRLHEVPYSLKVDGRLESGIIDALYHREGMWTLVEFKTDRLRGPDELARLLEEEGYLEQAGRYLAATEALLGQQPRVVLCFLNVAGSVLLLGPDGEPVSL